MKLRVFNKENKMLVHLTTDDGFIINYLALYNTNLVHDDPKGVVLEVKNVD